MLETIAWDLIRNCIPVDLRVDKNARVSHARIAEIFSENRRCAIYKNYAEINRSSRTRFLCTYLERKYAYTQNIYRMRSMMYKWKVSIYAKLSLQEYVQYIRRSIKSTKIEGKRPYRRTAKNRFANVDCRRILGRAFHFHTLLLSVEIRLAAQQIHICMRIVAHPELRARDKRWWFIKEQTHLRKCGRDTCQMPHSFWINLVPLNQAKE